MCITEQPCKNCVSRPGPWERRFIIHSWTREGATSDPSVSFSFLVFQRCKSTPRPHAELQVLLQSARLWLSLLSQPSQHSELLHYSNLRHSFQTSLGFSIELQLTFNKVSCLQLSRGDFSLVVLSDPLQTSLTCTPYTHAACTTFSSSPFKGYFIAPCEVPSIIFAWKNVY